MDIYLIRKLILASLLLTLLAVPQALADNVTAHGTVGIMEAQLVNKQLEQVGTVEVWNTEMTMNIVIKPFTDRCIYMVA